MSGLHTAKTARRGKIRRRAESVPRAMPQVIYEGGKPAFAVLPWAEYQMLASAGEPVDETALSDEALALRARERDDGYRVPLDVVARVVEGANPLKVYREWRGLTQARLAARAGINAVYLSQIETGQRQGSMTTLKKLARALDVGLDVIAR